jgi:hypothetical protein
MYVRNMTPCVKVGAAARQKETFRNGESNEKEIKNYKEIRSYGR